MAWLYFDLLNCLVDSNFSPVSFTFCNEFWSRNSICHFRGYSVSSPNWNQVQQPRRHFIISNVESCKSVKLPLHSEEPGNCTYNGFTKGVGGLWFLEAHRGQRHWLFWSSLYSDTHTPLFICPHSLSLRRHTDTAVFLVALFKLEKKTTCRFLKSCMWLRKSRGWNVAL